MSNKIRDFTNPSNQQGLAVTHSQLLSATNGMNNLWSVLNNLGEGNGTS